MEHERWRRARADPDDQGESTSSEVNRFPGAPDAIASDIGVLIGTLPTTGTTPP